MHGCWLGIALLALGCTPRDEEACGWNYCGGGTVDFAIESTEPAGYDWSFSVPGVTAGVFDEYEEMIAQGGRGFPHDMIGSDPGAMVAFPERRTIAWFFETAVHVCERSSWL